MADVLAIFGVLLFLGITFPGILTAAWLLFPATVARAQQRLERTPWRCLGVGLAVALLLAIPIALFLALPSGLTQFLGFSFLALVLALTGLGAAGLAAKMADGLQRQTGGRLSSAGAFVRGSLALELATAFPFIGWFVIFPLVVLASLGATAFALFPWRPAEESAPNRVAAPAGPTPSLPVQG